jgi:hypothetical protein
MGDDDDNPLSAMGGFVHKTPHAQVVTYAFGSVCFFGLFNLISCMMSGMKSMGWRHETWGSKW